jgi:hypothetical protein
MTPHVGVVMKVAAGSNWQLFRSPAKVAGAVFRAHSQDSAN